MIVVHEARPADSPYVEGITYGRTESDGSTVRPAECRWHMVFVRRDGEARALVVGAWTTAGVASWISEVVTSPVLRPLAFASSSSVGWARPRMSTEMALS